MDAEGEHASDGFRLSTLIDLVFPSWRDVVIHPPDGSMGKAMRYYRMWIYVTVCAVAFPALVFAGVTIWIFNSWYFQLLPLPVYDWTFVYMYLAVFVQIVPSPVLGYLGAKKLNECLLWCFWGSMVLLCIGDAVIGVVWAMRSSHLDDLLLKHLYVRLNHEYGIDADFTKLWDTFQLTERCCGVHNATDFTNTEWFRKLSTASNEITPLTDGLLLPSSCCGAPLDATKRDCSWTVDDITSTSHGCYLVLHAWMHKMGDILFVLGYSLFAFVRAGLSFCLYGELTHFVRKIRIRGIPRPAHRPSTSTNFATKNLHRTQDNTLRNNRSSIPHRYRSMRRWSFMRNFRGFRTNLQTSADTPQIHLTEFDQTEGVLPQLNSTVVKLKAINEENSALL